MNASKLKRLYSDVVVTFKCADIFLFLMYKRS